MHIRLCQTETGAAALTSLVASDAATLRRRELIRPVSVDLDLEDGFWRVTGVDYDADEDAGRRPLLGVVA